MNLEKKILEDFDKLYGRGDDKDMLFLNYDEDATGIIKSFISSALKEVREQTKKEILEIIDNRKTFDLKEIIRKIKSL